MAVFGWFQICGSFSAVRIRFWVVTFVGWVWFNADIFQVNENIQCRQMACENACSAHWSWGSSKQEEVPIDSFAPQDLFFRSWGISGLFAVHLVWELWCWAKCYSGTVAGTWRCLFLGGIRQQHGPLGQGIVTRGFSVVGCGSTAVTCTNFHNLNGTWTMVRLRARNST